MNKYAKLMYRAARLMEERSLLGPDEKWLIAELCMGAREIEQQAPVAEVQEHPYGHKSAWLVKTAPPENFYVGMKLYAAPQPVEQKPAPDVEALVEALELMVTTHEEGEWPTAAVEIEHAALAAHFKRDSQPSPAIQEGYAGATVWIGDKRVTQVVTEGSLKYESETGMAITHAAQACLDLLAAAHRKGGDV